MSGNLPTTVTPRLLDTLRSQPGLPEDVWYTVVATTLCILNRPDEIQAVYRHAVKVAGPDADTDADAVADPDADPDAGADAVADRHEQQQLRIARRLREALLKTSAIGGLPKTINALQELNKVVPPGCADGPHGGSPTNRRRDLYDTPAPQVLRRGGAFFDGCYGKVAGRVMTSLDHGGGTEDLGLAVRLAYGYLLSTTAVLSAAETSFVMIAGLIPQDVNPQLKGHLRGALNGGASVEQVRAVRHVSIEVCRASGMRLLTADDAPGCWGWRAEVQDL